MFGDCVKEGCILIDLIINIFKLVDSYCYFDFDGLIEDVDVVVEWVGFNGVSYMVIICIKISEFD